MAKGKIESSPSTEYGQEKGMVRYFINLLENRLAGRHKERIVKRVPADECRLGVLIPWRREVDEVDPLESEEGQEGTDAVPTEVSVDTTVRAEGTSQSQGSKSVPKNEDDEIRERPHQEGRDEQDYVRRPPSSLGTEFLVESNNKQVIIEVDAGFAIYTPHLPTFKEQTESLGEVGEEGIPKGGMTLADVWQRRTVNVEGIRFTIPGQENDNGVVQAELDRVIEDALSRPDAMPRFDLQPKLEPEILSNEKNFQTWVEEFRKKYPLRRPPLRALIEARAIPGAIPFLVETDEAPMVGYANFSF